MTKLKLNTESKAWIAYDAGNSAFATTIVAAFFPIFYTEFWSSGVDSLVATSYYTWTLTISNLVLLFSAPIIGSITDLSRTTKKLFTLFTLISIIFVALLFTLEIGAWFQALIFFGIANYCFSAGNILYDKIVSTNCSSISAHKNLKPWICLWVFRWRHAFFSECNHDFISRSLLVLLMPLKQSDGLLSWCLFGGAYF